MSFLLYSSRFTSHTKHAFLSVIVLTTGYAVMNNIQAIRDLGISPLGLS